MDAIREQTKRLIQREFCYWVKIPNRDLNPKLLKATISHLVPSWNGEWWRRREQKRMIDRRRGGSRRVSRRRESIDEKEKRRRHRRLGFWDRKRRFFSTSWWWLGRVSSRDWFCCDLRSNLERLAKPLHRFERFLSGLWERRLEISNSKLVTRTWDTLHVHTCQNTHVVVTLSGFYVGR